jgi:choline-sulfatase
VRGLLFVLSAVSAVAAAACSRSDASTSLPAPDASFAAAPSVTLALVDAARPPSPKRPPADLNVIFLSVDCLRADMPWAGYPRPIAPRLTELEKRAVSYTHAYSMSSYTSMSLGGLLGGRPPSEMSRDGYFFSTYSRTNVMFPELLQAAGIHTMAAHAHGYFKSAGFDQGFDKYELVPNLKWNSTTDENISSPQLEGIAERMLGDPANETERFFAWFHFLDPHDQYLPHPGIGPYGPTARDRYDAEVTFTDQYIGKLLDFVATRSWASRTAIIVTADHGEAFGEHNRFLHGFELWENLIRVPLFFVVPGAPPHHVDEPRSAVDLAPTILDLFGVAQTYDGGDPGFEGTSLVPELYGATPEPRDVLVDLPPTSDNDRRRALIHGHMKIIGFMDDKYFQAFDLDADPTESTPIIKGEAFTDIAARYRAREKTIKDLPGYGCKEDCLNGAYAKKKPDAGAP